MLHPIDLVLLDLGNTLYYDPKPWPDLLRAADEALWRSLQAAGVNVERHQAYGRFETLFDLYNSDHRKDVSEPTTARILRELLKRNGYRVQEQVLREALHAMYAVTQENWLIEPDAIPVLDDLKRKGFHLGVISNAADDENTQTLIDKGGIRPYLEFIVSSAAYGRRKPDAGIFQLALDYFGIEAGRAIMIGDTYEADIVGARAVGIHTAWMRHGEGEAPPEHPAADVQIASLSEIPALVSRKA